jgi:hypothetical protein
MLRLLLTLTGIALILYLLQIPPAAAHGTGTIHLASVPAGDFLLTVWTAPESPRVGELHVIVGVATAADGAVVLDDDLRLEVTASSGLSAPLVDIATREKSDNKFLYEANLVPPEAAWYQIHVNVSHPELQGGEVSFTVEVFPTAGPNWLLIGLALLLSIALAVTIWLRFRRRVAHTNSPAPIR